MSLVSVILPTRNRADTIFRAVGSVLQQSFADFELIVVDDDSLDCTQQIVQSIGDARIQYVKLSKRLGPAGARNAGIDRAAGEFIAFQDSDDEWFPEKLAKQMSVLGRDQNCGVVYSNMLRVFKDGNTYDYPAPTVSPGELINSRTNTYATQNVGIVTCLMRKRCLVETGGFNTSLDALEDLELFIRLSRHFAFYHIMEPLVRYHDSDGISCNFAAQARARRMLLSLYEEELKEHRRFVAFELANIAALERL